MVLRKSPIGISEKFYFPPATKPLMAKRLVTAVFLAALMILLSTNSLLVDQGTQTETEILSDEIRLESISSNSPGQVLGHIDTHDTLSIGRQFACAVTENSSVVCWGRTVPAKPESGPRGPKRTTT